MLTLFEIYSFKGFPNFDTILTRLIERIEGAQVITDTIYRNSVMPHFKEDKLGMYDSHLYFHSYVTSDLKLLSIRYTKETIRIARNIDQRALLRMT